MHAGGRRFDSGRLHSLLGLPRTLFFHIAYRDDGSRNIDFVKIYADYRWGPGGTASATFTQDELNTIVEVTSSSGRPAVAHAVTAEVRLYDHLFSEIEPDKIEIPGSLNPHSLEVLTGCQLEPSLKDAQAGDRFQFLRMGYFIADAVDSQPGSPIFNRTTPLRDTWAKVQKKG